MKKDRTIRRINHISCDSAVGRIVITASAKGVLTMTLNRQPDIREKKNQATLRLKRLIKRLKAYFSGAKVSFPDKLDLSAATPFQVNVWQATRSIPYGETRSYRWIAGQTGRPAAARAVGQALNKNPLPIVIPCHRVIASDGSLGGYSGGLEMKRYLLKLEHSSSA